MTRPRLAFLVIAFLAIASSATATTPPVSDAARCDLNEFTDGLTAISSFRIDRDVARSSIDSLTPEQTMLMHSSMSALGNWQALPPVLASLEEGQRQHDLDLLARITESATAPGMVTEEMRLEQFRSDMLFLIGQLQRFAPVMDATFADRVEHARHRIEGMPAAALPLLRDEYARSVASWGVAAVATPLERLGPINLNGCGSCCGDVITCVGCWIDLVGCLVGEVASLAQQVANYVAQITNFVTTFFNTTLPQLISDIAAIPTQVAAFFVDVFNDIANFVTTQFNSLIAAIPDTVDEVISYIGINWNNVDWNTLASSIPTIAPPCPQQAVDIAAEVCDRGGDALTQLLFDLMPDDGLSFGFKVGAALIHYPLAYLCQCNDIQEAIEFADAQAAHRTLTSERLDLKLSTRATQASVDVLSASLSDLDNDVALVEAKIDTLDATAGRIETTVNHIEATTNSTETKVDALISGNSDQQAYLTAFETLVTRLRIEENMLEVAPDTVSLFQLPLVFGGKLETVALIVADTIQMNLLANQLIFGAERELQRGDALRAAGDFARAFEAYRSAYTEAVK